MTAELYVIQLLVFTLKTDDNLLDVRFYIITHIVHIVNGVVFHLLTLKLCSRPLV